MTETITTRYFKRPVVMFGATWLGSTAHGVFGTRAYGDRTVSAALNRHCDTNRERVEAIEAAAAEQES